MQQYYTSIEVENGRYIGSVHNTINNTVEYRTKPYYSQVQAIMDITEFLKTKKPASPQSKTILNTANFQPSSQPTTPRRCCGR